MNHTLVIPQSDIGITFITKSHQRLQSQIQSERPTQQGCTQTSVRVKAAMGFGNCLATSLLFVQISMMEVAHHAQKTEKTSAKYENKINKRVTAVIQKYSPQIWLFYIPC